MIRMEKESGLKRETFRVAENTPLDSVLDMGQHPDRYLAASVRLAKGGKAFLESRKAG